MAYSPAGAGANRIIGSRTGAELGAPIEEILPGDVVWFAPGEEHWHEATLTTALTHIAIHEQLNGKTVEWFGKVSDEQYLLYTKKE